MVGLQTLDLAIGVRVPASQPLVNTGCWSLLTEFAIPAPPPQR